MLVLSAPSSNPVPLVAEERLHNLTPRQPRRLNLKRVGRFLSVDHFVRADQELGRTAQRTETLSGIWRRLPEEAKALADALVEIGFFERRGSSQEPEYWVPFLYRDALNMIQGTAELEEE